MILRCTAKLARFLEVTPKAVDAASPEDSEWYANLLTIDRHKQLLITHADTLFSVFIANIRKRDVTPIGPAVTAAITAALQAEGLPTDALGHLDPEDVQVAKTASRVILGSMNDMTTLIHAIAENGGGIADTDVNEINDKLHQFINSPTGYTPPIDLVRELDWIRRSERRR